MQGLILCFVLGIALLQQLPGLPAQASLNLAWSGLTLGFLLLAILRRFASLAGLKRGITYLAWAAGGFLAGLQWALYCASLHAQNPFPESLEQRELQVTGVISSLPVADQQSQHFQFLIETMPAEFASLWQTPVAVNLAWYGDKVCGNDLSRLAAGQRWQLPLKLKRPHGTQNPAGMDYELWLFERDLHASGYVAVPRHTEACAGMRMLQADVAGWSYQIERWRGVLRDKILKALPEHPYAAIIVALVIGEQRAISQAQWQLFNRTGIGHLISISGLHITMLASLAASLAALIWRSAARHRRHWPHKLPRQKLEALVAAITALCYTALAGFGVPAQRTLIMLLIYAWSIFAGRNLAPSKVLSLALFFVLVIDPWAVLAAGFWLSFIAVALLIYGARWQAQSQSDSRWRKIWQQIVQASHTQYLMTVGMIPVSILLFSQFSLISPVANALAIPLISLLVTPLALLGCFLPGLLASLVLQLAHGLLSLLMVVLAWLAQLPAAVWVLPAPDSLSFILASLGLLYLLAPRGLTNRSLGLLCCLPMLLPAPSAPAPGEFRAQFIDVGQGMAVLIETAGHRLLYDTGPAYLNQSDAGARIIWPYLRQRGITALDMLMISHQDSDHSGGVLSLHRQLHVQQVVSSLRDDQLKEKFMAADLKSAMPSHQACRAGQSWIWEGIHFKVLHPTDEELLADKLKANPRSCVLHISNQSYSLLLAGDIEAAQERQLLQRQAPGSLQATVLLAPHHGSATSSTTEFLQAVQPRLAIFQQGYKNRYHHPNFKVWQRYADFGITRLRSDAQGAIQINFGASLRYFSQRQASQRYWHTDLSRLNPDYADTVDEATLNSANFDIYE